MAGCAISRLVIAPSSQWVALASAGAGRCELTAAVRIVSLQARRPGSEEGGMVARSRAALEDMRSECPNALISTQGFSSCMLEVGNNNKMHL